MPIAWNRYSRRSGTTAKPSIDLFANKKISPSNFKSLRAVQTYCPKGYWGSKGSCRLTLKVLLFAGPGKKGFFQSSTKPSLCQRRHGQLACCHTYFIVFTIKPGEKALIASRYEAIIHLIRFIFNKKMGLFRSMELF